MAGKVRLIQVGTGGWGRNWYATILRSFPGVDVVAFVDSDPVSLKNAVRNAGIDAKLCHPTLGDAMAAAESDAVLITASLPGHVPSALQALRAGRHVLVEKPFAPSVADAKRVVATAEAAGRIVAVSQNYRYHPAPQLAARIVAEGSLGALGSISLDFRRDNVLPDPKRSRHEHLPNPLLADMAIHHFDLMRMVTGRDAESIQCATWNPPWSSYVDDPAGAATVKIADGISIAYRGSWVSPGPKTSWAGEWRMEFARGEVVWSSRYDAGAEEDRLEIRPFGRAAKQPKLPRVRYLDRAGALNAFVEAVTGKTPAERLQIAGARNIGSLALTYAAIRAAKLGRSVSL